jgi:hypothetical protein
MTDPKLIYKIINLEPYGSPKAQTGISVENFSFSEENVKKHLENTKNQNEVKS